MSLTQDNDVVHTLAADRPDQPLGKAVLPRRGGCNGLVPYAHGPQSTCERSGQKISFQRQLPDLGVQRFHIDRRRT